MSSLPGPTIIVRHRTEKTRKCSVFPLKGLDGFVFYGFPLREKLELDGYVRLGIGGTPLGAQDVDKGLLILDSSWRRVGAMEREFAEVPVRGLPPLRTAFPRLSKCHEDPAAGLATVEALYAALTLLGRDTTSVLDHYRWRGQFLELNRGVLG